jgi:hypothetical protein
MMNYNNSKFSSSYEEKQERKDDEDSLAPFDEDPYFDCSSQEGTDVVKKQVTSGDHHHRGTKIKRVASRPPMIPSVEPTATHDNGINSSGHQRPTNTIMRVARKTPNVETLLTSDKDEESKSHKSYNIDNRFYGGNWKNTIHNSSIAQTPPLSSPICLYQYQSHRTEKTTLPSVEKTADLLVRTSDLGNLPQLFKMTIFLLWECFIQLVLLIIITILFQPLLLKLHYAGP